MKFDLISDIHLDANRNMLPVWELVPNEGSDVLIICGDLAEISNIHLIRDFLKEARLMYEKVIYLAGNHEYYGTSIQHGDEKLEDLCARCGVNFFQKTSLIIDDYAFIGATLWTDMNKGDPATMHGIKQMIADFTYITYEDEINGPRHIFSAEDCCKEFRHTMLYFENECERLDDKKVILLTHHAMSSRSIASRYATAFVMNGAFYSDAEDFFIRHKNVKVHCHGHMHLPFHYRIPESGVEVYCNPYGYQMVRGEMRANYQPVQVEVE